MAANENLWRWLYWLFWKKLCIRPDKKIFGTFAIVGWWYNFTGKIAFYFHCKYCSRCRNRKSKNYCA